MTSQEAAQATFTHPADAVPARILVADDEPGIRAFIGRALDAAGYLTDFAANGAEALRRAMLAYMNDASNPRNAYPAYWAPFELVGEGR